MVATIYSSAATTLAFTSRPALRTTESTTSMCFCNRPAKLIDVVLSVVRNAGREVKANGKYNVNVFLQPSSQTQPCTTFYYLGVATANVDSVIVDCQHNDWAWMFGPDTAGTYGDYGLGVLPPPASPAADLNTPGGRDFA